jgi:hypothetical protein
MKGYWRDLFLGSVLLFQTPRNGSMSLQVLIAHYSHPVTGPADGWMFVLEGSLGEVVPVFVEMHRQSPF